jgi:hypothetical protein
MIYDTSPRCDVCGERADWFGPGEPAARPAIKFRHARAPIPTLTFVCEEHRQTPDAANREWARSTPAELFGYVQSWPDGEAG